MADELSSVPFFSPDGLIRGADPKSAWSTERRGLSAPSDAILWKDNE